MRSRSVRERGGFLAFFSAFFISFFPLSITRVEFLVRKRGNSTLFCMHVENRGDGYQPDRILRDAKKKGGQMRDCPLRDRGREHFTIYSLLYS
jgi:hypothetical protein